MRRLFAVVLAIIGAAAASGQTASVGRLEPHGSFTRTIPGAALTFIDLSHPLNVDASLTTATVDWYQAAPNGGCGGAFKIKFIRPLTLLGNFTVVDERGPFTAALGPVQVSLTPPVNVRRGDLIALTQLQPATCGGVFFTVGRESELTMSTVSDPIVGSNIASGTLLRGETLDVRASNATSYLGGIIPAVGTIGGNFGSFFRTSLQLTNPEQGTITGRLVFHPVAQPASPNDVSMNYTLSSGQTLSFSDILPQMSTAGFGSLDVVVTSGPRPVAVARVYNDQGGGGTNGFTEDLVTPDDARVSSEYAVLPVPTDPSTYRMNVGIRTLDDGATISISNVNASGSAIGTTVTRTFPSNYFQQFDASDFLGGVAPMPGGWISVQVTDGSAVIYATTTDNHTNDSSMKIGGRD